MMIIENSFQQGEPEWHEARLNSVGGTDISKIITTKGDRSKSRDDFITEKASQIITRESKQVYPTYEMKWGHKYEPIARSVFSFVHDIEISQCAMIFNDDQRNWHISPDGFNDSLKFGLEIKCPQLKEFKKTVDKKTLPTKHILQVQTSLALTGWDSWWFMSFFPKLNPFIIEVERDEGLIDIIKEEVELFNSEVKKEIKGLMG